MTLNKQACLATGNFCTLVILVALIVPVLLTGVCIRSYARRERISYTNGSHAISITTSRGWVMVTFGSDMGNSGLDGPFWAHDSIVPASDIEEYAFGLLSVDFRWRYLGTIFLSSRWGVYALGCSLWLMIVLLGHLVVVLLATSRAAKRAMRQAQESVAGSEPANRID